MKGLLLKDWYMMKKYYRSYLVIAAAFITVSFFDDDNLFFLYYPCLLCGIIPLSLLSYDERSGWMQYSGTMPYTRAQIVSAKYVIGMLAQLAMLVVTGIAQGAKMMITGDVALGDFAMLMFLMMIVSALTSSIPLPFIFKLGVEKGRIAYYVMIGVVCGASVLAPRLLKGQFVAEMRQNLVLAILAAAGIGIYILSWYMSIVFFQKREIQ